MVSPVLRQQRENPTPDEVASRLRAGCSPNYRGDHTLAANRPAAIPQEQNCSVWLSGLPPDITTHELLAAIRGAGRVYASHITPPGGRYTTAAAKVVFFEAAAAQAFLRRCADAGGLPVVVVRPRPPATASPDQQHPNPHPHPHPAPADAAPRTCCWRARVEPDRNRVAQPRAPGDHSRVLLIRGPPGLVNVPFLAAYFAQRFAYQVDEVIALVEGRCINVLEWRFGSYRCQAKWAWQAIGCDELFRREQVTVKFDRDPCEW